MSNYSDTKAPMILPYASLYTAQHSQKEQQKDKQYQYEQLTIARQLVQNELEEMCKRKQNEKNNDNKLYNDRDVEVQQTVEREKVEHTNNNISYNNGKTNIESNEVSTTAVKESLGHEQNANNCSTTIDSVRQVESVNVDMFAIKKSAQSANDHTNTKLQENTDALRYETLLSEFISNAVLEEELNGKKADTQQIQSLLEYMQRVQFDLVMAQREIRDINAARYLEQGTFVEKLQQLHNDAVSTQEKIEALEKILNDSSK